MAYVKKDQYQLIRDKVAGLQSPTDAMQRHYQQSLMFSRLALAAGQVNNTDIANKFLSEALASAKLLPAREQSIATGFIASAQAVYAKPAVSVASFRQANELLNTVADKTERMTGYAALSEAYAQSGDRLGALAICQNLIKAANNLSGEQQATVLSSIVPVIASIDSTEAALNLAAKININTRHEQAVYQLLSKEILANQVYAAMSVADRFSSSVYKAKGLSLLARIQTDSVLQSLATENFNRALNFSEGLSSPQTQAVAWSEIARYQSNSGDAKAASTLMQRSLSLVKVMKPGNKQDRMLAAIAKHQVRSGQIKQSKHTASLIADGDLADIAFSDIGNVGKVFSVLGGKSHSLSVASSQL